MDDLYPYISPSQIKLFRTIKLIQFYINHHTSNNKSHLKTHPCTATENYPTVELLKISMKKIIFPYLRG
jgi:hypothetical protein